VFRIYSKLPFHKLIKEHCHVYNHVFLEENPHLVSKYMLNEVKLVEIVQTEHSTNTL
jgi:hypothetical protein